MALVQCAICRINTLSTEGKCQHCGNPLKVSMWRRKLRRREAYAVLLIVLGIAVTTLLVPAGVILMLSGCGMIVMGFLRPRVRF
jgi:hypothetical protein